MSQVSERVIDSVSAGGDLRLAEYYIIKVNMGPRVSKLLRSHVYKMKRIYCRNRPGYHRLRDIFYRAPRD